LYSVQCWQKTRRIWISVNRHCSVLCNCSV